MKANKTLYHLGFWALAYLFWIVIFRNSTLVLVRGITIQFCYLLFIAANYYYNLWFTVPRLLNKKRYGVFGLCFLAGIFVTAVLRVPVVHFMNADVFKVDVSRFDYTAVFWDSFVNIFFWVIAILATSLIIEKVRAQRYIEQIEREKAENELNFLRAQFNPHFLFNSINSIYAHIDKTNREARDMLLVFSEMLRYQLYECNVEQIPLGKEINYLNNYIALQQSRMDERIKVMFCTQKVNSNMDVAPLLFITFIENAFKYVGFNEGRENQICIELEGDRDELTLAVRNTKDCFISQSKESSGLGIANAKRRLEILYPQRHSLAIDDSAHEYSVKLTLWS